MWRNQSTVKNCMIYNCGWPLGWPKHAGDHSLTYLLTQSLTYSITYLLTYLLTHVLTHSLTHLLTQSLTYSLNHLLTYFVEESPTWESNRFSAVEEIPRTLWNPKVHYLIHKWYKCTLVQALRLCTSPTAQRVSRGTALLFLDHSTRREWGVSVSKSLYVIKLYIIYIHTHYPWEFVGLFKKSYTAVINALDMDTYNTERVYQIDSVELTHLPYTRTLSFLQCGVLSWNIILYNMSFTWCGHCNLSGS